MSDKHATTRDSTGRQDAAGLVPTSGYHLGTFFGIPVYIDTSWIIVFLLVTMSLAPYLAQQHRNLPDHIYWLAAALTSCVFFASVLLHELGHSIAALRLGIPVRSITLFLFGGVAAIEREPDRPSHELLITICGPLVSLALAGLFFLLHRDVLQSVDPTWAMLLMACQWLATINLMLFAFNLIPGFPLDGGRLLRAIVWKVTGQFDEGTRVAATTGKVFAYLFIAYGVWQALLGGNLTGGLWVAFIGWFLLSAARASISQVQTRRNLAGILASDVMDRNFTTVSGEMNLSEVIDNAILTQGVRTVYVVDDDRFEGLATLHEIKKIPRHLWPATPVRDVMRPKDSLVTALPTESVGTLIETMEDNEISQVPVVIGESLVGVVTRAGVLAGLRNRKELNIARR